MLKLFQKLLVPMRDKVVGLHAPNVGNATDLPLNTGEALTPDWEIGLIPHAQRWLQRLPANQRPAELCLAFPRIGNRMSLLWPSSALVDRYFDDLLTDRRGGRKGFPAGVQAEVERLREYRLLSGDLNDSFYGEPDDIVQESQGPDGGAMQKTNPGFQARF